MADNDADQEDPLFGGMPYQGLTPQSLEIEMIAMDDLFSGRSSKYRYRRVAGQEDLRFLFDSEFYVYTKFFIIPQLENNLTGGENYYVWLACLLRFHQIGDRTDVCERWSSYRLVSLEGKVGWGEEGEGEETM